MFQHFSTSTRFAYFCTFGVEVEKTMENHLVDPTEKAENAESSENGNDRRNQKYITPNLSNLRTSFKKLDPSHQNERKNCARQAVAFNYCCQIFQR